MISKYTYKKLTWIDVESPSREEIARLVEEYDIPDLVGEELAVPNVRARVDRYPNCLYLVFRFPHTDDHRRKDSEQEVDFVLGKDFLITVRYDHVHAIFDFAKLFETHSILERGYVGEHAGNLFYQLMKMLYRNAFGELERMDDDIKEVEKKVFRRHEEQMVKRLSKLNRKLLDYKRSLRFHSHLLESFEESSAVLFGSDYAFYARAITAEYNKIQSVLDTYREVVNDLRSTNDSLLSSKTNRTMMNLMMMSFVIFPLSLIAGIFGMNVTYLPIIGHKHDFWIVLGIMIGATLMMLLYFKRKRWL